MSYYDWTKILADKTNNELNRIINDRSSEPSEKVGAAIIELEKRGENIEPIIEEAKVEENISKLPTLSSKKKIMEFLLIFKPSKSYYITPILLNLNIFIFIIMAISGVNIMLPDNESLLNWGANFRPLTLEGDLWRLITSCFLHIGIFHLLMNMYALVYIGLLLEPHLGKTRFLSAYILTGISASLTSLWWHDNTISAGASGAIFGMYGVFLAMLTTNLIEKSARKALLTSIIVFVGYNLLNGLKGGIDNAAHIGGLISGLAIGYAYFPSLKNYNDLKIKLTTVGLLATVFFLSSFLLYNQIPKSNGKYEEELKGAAVPEDILKYQEKMKRFLAMESMALEVYKLNENTPKEQFLAEIKDRGLYYWKENIILINDLEKLDLPDQLHAQNRKLLEYCNLRIKSYELIYKSVDENSDEYRTQIENCTNQIEKIINELKEMNK